MYLGVYSQVYAMLQCSSCGNWNADGATFCSTCGATVTARQASQSMPVTSTAMKPVPVVRTISPLAQSPSQNAAPMVRAQTPTGSCFYHSGLPAGCVCTRCGRAICFSCTKYYGQLTFCPQCYWSVAPRSRTAAQAPYGQQY